MNTAAAMHPGPATTGHHPRSSIRHLGPQWYAAVMGTAIVANGGATLPHLRTVRPAFVLVWALSALALMALVAARGVHWLRHRDQARVHLLDPAVAPFYGCPPMALLAVGGGTLAVGGDVIGARSAVAVDAALWTAGTLTSLAAAVGVPYLMITRHRNGPSDATPMWLLPVVAPMVAAALGPPLASHLPAGQSRETLLVGCAAMFGLSLIATLMIVPLVFGRLVVHGPLPVPLTPALCLVLGPLGQSTTALGNLTDAAPDLRLAPYFAVAYGVPVMGFALLWLLLAAALVVRALRRGMPFALNWWGFTFPVGTCVTGTAQLAHHTGLPALSWLAVGLYALLVAVWALVAVRTALGLARRTLLVPVPADGVSGPPQARPAEPQEPAPTRGRTR